MIFGVQNSDKSIEGLCEALATHLDDVNNILQKINRHLEPNVEFLRAKKYDKEGKIIVALLIPQSIGKTHLISKDGQFTYPSGKAKVLLKKGTFYVRRSAGNHLGDSRDLEGILERRIDQFRVSLMDKVARVVKAPESSEVFILSKDPSDKDAKRFIIEDSPESIPIKGMSFSVPPEGVEEEIAAWTVLSKSDSSVIPPALRLLKWYNERGNIRISVDHKLAMFVFSLWRGLPAFYWLQGLRIQDIQPVLIDTIKRHPTGTGCNVSYLFNVSSYLGKSFYKKALSAIGSYKDRMNPAQMKIPSNIRKEFGGFSPSQKQTIKDLKDEKLIELDQNISKALEKQRIPGVAELWNLQKIDCFLYAQDDKYE